MLTQQAEEEGRTICNFYEETYTIECPKTGVEKTVTTRRPITDMWEIWIKVSMLCDNRLHRVGGLPFYVMDGGEIRYIKNATELFGLLFKLGAKIKWADKMTGAVSKGEFYQYVGYHATAFDMVSTLPHYPPIDRVYYGKAIEPKQTGRLDEMIDMINYATPVDRILLKSFFMTPFWGGPGGSRPAFLIDGQTSDEAGRRGIGKTTLTDLLALLCGGEAIDVSNKTDGEDIKKRILGAGEARIVRMDNVKSDNFSNEVIESLITIGRISGHRMYIGQATMMNWFSFVMTFNDAQLSKDMAQRTIIIRLKRPKYDPDWETNLRFFIERHADEIIADIGYELTRNATVSTTGKLRFPYWEKMVLSKVAGDELPAITARIKGEQDGSDTDDQLSEDIREILEGRISNLWRVEAGTGNKKYFDPATDCLGLSKGMVCDWLKPLFSANSSRRFRGRKLEASLIPELSKIRKQHRGYFYYFWVGGAASRGEELPPSVWRVNDENGVVNVEEWRFD